MYLGNMEFFLRAKRTELALVVDVVISFELFGRNILWRMSSLNVVLVLGFLREDVLIDLSSLSSYTMVIVRNDAT